MQSVSRGSRQNADPNKGCNNLFVMTVGIKFGQRISHTALAALTSQQAMQAALFFLFIEHVFYLSIMSSFAFKEVSKRC